MKKTISITAAAAILMSASFVFAQDSGLKNMMKPKAVRERVQEARNTRMEVRKEISEVRANSKEQLKDLRADTKEKIKAASSPAEIKDAVKDARAEKKEILKDRIASTTKAVGRGLKEVTTKRFGITIQQSSVALKQFDNLADRVSSRIDKLKASGVDTSPAETAYSNAKTAIETARADAQAVKDLVAAVKDGSDAKAIGRQIETAIKKANNSAKAAHKALDEAAKILIKLSRTETPAAAEGTE